MIESMRAFLAKTDADTYRRLVAQNSAAVGPINKDVSRPIYYAHCYYCAWAANDFLSLEEVERRAEEHLKENPDHAGHILTAFNLAGVQVNWR